MIDIKTRSNQKELLDQDNIPFADIQQNLRELEFINKHLGGHAITIEGFKKFTKRKIHFSICEIGCGGGDNLNALQRYSNKKFHVKFTGIDLNADCIAYAKKNTIIPDISFFISDYKKVNFANDKPDIIFSSLFCHHFSNEELVAMMQWMKVNSRLGFFINDLHRNLIAYHFIKFVSNIFSRSYLVKNDAPLSVLRSFKKKEWKNILDKAGITNYTIQWKWAFRYLIVVHND